MGQWQNVDSSLIEKLAYNEKDELLTVKFKKGGVYSYQGVPRKTFEKMMVAPSVGSFFARQIRNAFPFAKEDAE